MLYNNVIQRKAKKPHVCFRNSNNLVIKIVLTISFLQNSTRLRLKVGKCSQSCLTLSCIVFSSHYGHLWLRAGVVSNSPHLSASSGHSHGMVNGQKLLDLCSHSPDGRLPSPLTSPLLNDACSVRTDDEDEVRRKVCNQEPL